MAELTIFNVLNQIGAKNHQFWMHLPDASQKQFSPMMLMKWGVQSGLSPIRLQQVNNNLFNTPPYLQFAGLATVNPAPKTTRWKWTRVKQQGPTLVDMQIAAIQSAYSIDKNTAASTLPLFTSQELAELLDEYGNDPEDSKKQKTSKRKT